MLNDCLCQRILITVCLTFTLAAIEMNEGLTVIGRGSESSCILLLKDGENILVCECVTAMTTYAKVEYNETLRTPFLA